VSENVSTNKALAPESLRACPICKLRKKLAQAGAGDLIGTVWGRGYVLRDPANGGRISLAPERAVAMA
jgi:DNA-binding response OmpR family regulator